jgi:C-terminal processing protease CtpA/Prc
MLEGTGIRPDIEIRFDSQADLQNGGDPQMDAATKAVR